MQLFWLEASRSGPRICMQSSENVSSLRKSSRQSAWDTMNCGTKIREIMRTLEAAALVNATDPLPRCLAEGTFAAQYLLKEDDLIPDSVPGIGLADDAILVKSIVARHGRKLARSGWDF